MKLSDQQLRILKNQYTQQRDIAVKRVKRLEKAGYQDTNAVTNWNGEIPKLRDLKPEQIPMALQDLLRFNNSPYSRVGAIKKEEQKQLRGLAASGYSGITSKNIKKYRDFWKDVKAAGLNKMYGSDDIHNMFEQAQKLKISNYQLMKDFEWWAENIDTVSRINPDVQRHTTADFRKALDRAFDQ